MIINKSSRLKIYFDIINAINGWIKFFKKVKIIDFLNDNNKLNLVNENPKDRRTHGRQM